MYLKKLLGSVSLVTLLIASNAVTVSANDDFAFNTKSLVGFEAGYATFNVDNNFNALDSSSYISPTQSFNEGDIGLKIGAQGNDFRVFLSAKNFFVGSEYDYFITLGGEVDYLFNFSKSVNFFIGANGGYLKTKFQGKNERFTREMDGIYYGGELGFNFHINSKYDLEIGTRIMTTNAKSTKNSVKYSIDYMLNGYASFIIKFDMD